MSRSSSRAYGTPVASHSFGYIEIGVKPGIVFSSLTTKRAVGLQEEVDPRHRLAAARGERFDREAPHGRGELGAERRGNAVARAFPSSYLSA